MKIQLTKDKTIELNFPGGGGGSSKSITDLVGIELFSGHPNGCPALHLFRKKKAWHIDSLGFVKEPNGVLPESWDEVTKQPTWEMPKDFQAPHAALAVNSAQASFGQASPEAIIQEMMHGPSQTTATVAAQTDPGKKKFGLKHAAPAAPKPAASTESVRKPDFPEAGVPVSENGRRFAVRPSAEEGFHLCASLPEFQSLWVSRLLPEGKRPTTRSIQVNESALMASILAQPEFIAAKGTMLAIFVRDEAIYFAGYKDGMPVLWRRCPGVAGYLAMRKAVKKTLGIDEDLLNSVLEDSLIDPRPALVPFLQPILEQLDLARAYLLSKHGINAEKAMLLGLPCGASHWQHYAEEALKLQLVAPHPFDGIELDKNIKVDHPHDYLVALGAALAATEVEA